MRIEHIETKLEDGFILKDKNYIAYDGRKFFLESDCIRYEKILDAKERIKHIPFKSLNFMELDSWYYISSIDDFRAIQNYIAVVVQRCGWTDFDVYDLKNRFVNDWVSYYIKDNENGADCCNFKSFKEIQENLRKIQDDFIKLEKHLKDK